MGGDEFVIIVGPELFGDLDKVINNITSLFNKQWYLMETEYFCTMSMGIAFFPDNSVDVHEITRMADVAMYAAKRSGKNRYVYYSSEVESATAKRLDIENSMRQAVSTGIDEFIVFYQPVVNVDTQQCTSCEALVRWDSKALGFMGPGEFIPLAEYLGPINPIGEHVLAEAAKYCKYWNDMGHPEYKVNVNLSVVQLLQNDIVKKIKAVIDDVRINPGNLCLEVTESLAINDMVRMKKILGDIKKLGVKVALDDFGTGYSSLNHIREMPIDIIKIDRCFIEHLGEDDFPNSFVKMVRELANTIGVTVCVEGVETKEQYMLIKAMGIENIQGYFFDRPMAIEEFEEKYL